MTREQLTKHIEERIEELRFYSIAYKAVSIAAQKFDGKVLNKRIDAVIKQNLVDQGFHKCFGSYTKEYLTKFRVFNPVGAHGQEISFYIEEEDIVEGRFQFSTWVKRQNLQPVEDRLTKLYEALNHIQGILKAYEDVQTARNEYEIYLEGFGLSSYSNLLKP